MLHEIVKRNKGDQMSGETQQGGSVECQSPEGTAGIQSQNQQPEFRLCDTQSRNRKGAADVEVKTTFVMQRRRILEKA
jgi:hypothetical protein